MANLLETDYKILDPYVSVLIGEKKKRDKNINKVVNAFQNITDKNKKTLSEIVKAYDGDMDMFLQAIYFSDILSISNKNN